MSTAEILGPWRTATGPRLADTRTLSRWFAAVLMPIGPAAVALLRFVLPYNTTDDTAGMVDKVAAQPAAEQAVVWLGLVALFTLVPGALAALRLVRPRVPVLAAVTALLLVPGYLALFWGNGDLVALAGTTGGIERTTVARLLELTANDPTNVIAMVVFVAGHVLGSILLGVALWRSRAVHPVWAVAMIVSQPLHVVAAFTGNHPLDLVGWGLTAVAMGAGAVAVLRRSNDRWDVPPEV